MKGDILDQLRISASPHTKTRISSTQIMLCVILALLPAAAAGCIRFGVQALILLAVTVGTAVISEALWCLILRKQQTVTDCSAVITGLLLGMSLPPAFPIVKAAIGSFFAVIIVKMLFGGIGRNFVNPAATAYLLLFVVFHKEMTTWSTTADAVSSATPLSAEQTNLWDLFLGSTAGSIGETCALGILLGWIFLCISKVISPAPALSYLFSFLFFTILCGKEVLPQLFSGGLLLGACFMASDYTTTPLTVSGKCLFGIGCGFLNVMIRHYGGYPEGTAFAIIIMNLMTPFLTRITRTQPFGAVSLPKERKKKKKTTQPAEISAS